MCPSSATGSLRGVPLGTLGGLTEFPFMVSALEAGTIAAVMAAVAGWFMVLRRETFAGHSLSVMAFPGAAGAVLVGLPAAAGYFAVCALAGVVIATLGGRGGRHRGEATALTGIVQALGLGCGFLFLSLYGGVLAGYENLLFGDFLGITPAQVTTLGVVAAMTLGFFALAGRSLLFASVDEQVARARGVPVRGLAVAFLLVLGLAVAATAQITGVLLVFALLVAPAAAAERVTARIGASLGLTVALALVITWSGLALAYVDNRPVGFEITTVAFVVYGAVRLAQAAGERARARRRPRESER